MYNLKYNLIILVNAMALKLFSNKEIQILKSNKYTYTITNKSIKFTTEFKQLFYNKALEGMSPLNYPP